MLTMMRNMLRSPAAGGLFILLIVAMAAWGVTDIFGGGLGNNLVVAGDRALTDQQFDNAVERQLRTATDDRGRAISKEQALEQGIIDQIYGRQRFDILLRAYADKLGITATQAEIKDTITSIPAFRDTTDVFDPVLLDSYLRQEGYTQKTFEDEIEVGLTIGRLQQIPAAGLKAPGVLARIEAAYAGELRSGSWFRLAKSALPALEAPTDEDLQKLYDDRQDALREPERRRVSLLQLKADDFVARAEVAESDIENFYEAYKPERYTGPDTRTFTEFNFTTEETARASLGQIAGGAAADAVDSAASSAVRTGRSGSITSQRLSQQVFAGGSRPGSLHGPVENGEVWIVIRLEAITPGESIPFETVRDAIAEELALEQAIGFFYEVLPRFDDLIGTGASLEVIAADLGTPVLSFAAIDQRGISETGAYYRPLLEAEGLLDSLFNTQAGSLTDRIGTDEVTYLARVDAIIPERLPPIDEVRDLLAEAWTQQNEFEQLQTVAGEISARINSGESTLAEEAGRYGTIAQSMTRPVSRAAPGTELPPQLLGTLFTANRDGEVLSVPSQVDEIMILRLDTVDRPEPETLDLLAQSNIAAVQQQLNEDLFQAFFTEIQGEIELEENPSALAAYKSRIAPEQ